MVKRNQPSPSKAGNVLGHGGFLAERTKKSQAPIPLAQRYPAPELQAEKLRTWGVLLSYLWRQNHTFPRVPLRPKWLQSVLGELIWRAGTTPILEKIAPRMQGQMKSFTWVRSNSGNRSEIRSENCGFRIAQVVRRHPENVSTALLLNQVSEKRHEIWNEVSEIFSEICSEICPEIRPEISRACLAGWKVLPQNFTGFFPSEISNFKSNSKSNCTKNFTNTWQP